MEAGRGCKWGTGVGAGERRGYRGAGAPIASGVVEGARDERRALRAAQQAGRAERFTRRFRLPTPGTVGDRRGPRAAGGTRGGGCAPRAGGGAALPAVAWRRRGRGRGSVAARGPPLQARPRAGEAGLLELGGAGGSFAWEAREFFPGFIGLRDGLSFGKKKMTDCFR
jgi:hypothetical protein